MAIENQISELNVSSASYADKTTVVGQPDVPGLGTQAMQESVEYMPRNFIIPVLNKVIRFLNGTYSKKETDEAINAKVTEIGAGDMAQGVYDPSAEVQKAGGISAYVKSELDPVKEDVSTLNNTKYVYIWLPATGWSSTAPYTQSVAVSGMTADWVPGIPVWNLDDGWNPDADTLAAGLAEVARINVVRSEAGKLTFLCAEEKPNWDLGLEIPGLVEK